MFPLIFLFFTTAFFYSIVGFGGGSTYIALLANQGISYELIPKIGLVCNLLVTGMSSYQFYKKGLLDFKFMTPFLLTSVPAAFLGGLYPIEEKFFLTLVSAALLLSGLRLLIFKDPSPGTLRPVTKWTALAVGMIIGALSGLIGIGGGIFLSPIMLNMKWAGAKKVAACASFFILVNSLAGLYGQIVKTEGSWSIGDYWPLFVVVILGGQLGSKFGLNNQVPTKWIKLLTACLVLFVSIRLFIKLFGR